MAVVVEADAARSSDGVNHEAQGWVFPEACPLCSSPQDRWETFDRAPGEGCSLTYVICRDCGLVFQSPRMGEARLAEFYQAEYRLTVQGQEGPSDKDRWAQVGRARHLLAFVRGHLDAVKRFLDIGSSLGELLKTFRESYGCECVAVEPGEAYRLASQEAGLKAVGSLDEVGPQLKASFDLVAIAHVLEHVSDPVGYMRSLRQTWLAPGGHLLVEVPNLYGHPSFELAHLTAFSPSTLRAALQKAGYEVVAWRCHGRPYSRLLPLFITSLAKARAEPESQPGLQSTARGVRFRRALGMMVLRAARGISPILLGRKRLQPWAERRM